MIFATSAGYRRVFRWIHTWMGLTAGLIVAVVSLTGSIIVFRTEMEMASAPRAAGGSRVASLNEVVQQIAQTNPDARVRRVRFPAHEGDPFVVQVESAGKQERLLSEAATGRVLGRLNTRLVDWMIDLHRNLLFGKSGRKAVGILGIVLFTLAGSGMLLWLIGARKWRAWVSVRPQGGSRRFSFELHRAVGLWSYGLLSVVALTGIGLAYPDTLRGTLQWMTGGPATIKAPRVAKAAVRTLRPLDEYLATAAAAMPDAVPTELRLPEGDKGPVDLRLRRHGDLSSSGNRVYIEPATGRVLAVRREADQPFGVRVASAFAPIHYGEFGGFPTKLVWVLLGLMPSVLFVTGFITWWRPSRKKAPPAEQEDLALAGTAEGRR